MNAPRRAVTLVPLALAALAACAAVRPVPPAPQAPPARAEEPRPPDPFRGFAETVRRRALEAEESGDLRKAAFLFSAASRLDPPDRDSERRSRALAARLRESAQRHYLNGTNLAAAGDADGARREFLLALADDPDHAGARKGLDALNDGEDAVVYEAREGDSLRKIAGERYGDPGMASFVAWYNDLDERSPLRPGARLVLPVIGPPPPVEPHGKGHRDILAYPQGRDSAEADRRYREGVRLFQAGELEKAAGEWEGALRADPDHPRARRDLDRVRRMLEKLR